MVIPLSLNHAPHQHNPEILEETGRRVIDEEHKVSIQIDDIGTVNEVTQNYSDSFDRTADLYLSVVHKGKPQDIIKNKLSFYFLNKNNIEIYTISKDGQKKEAAISDIKKDSQIDIKTITSIIDFKTKQYKYLYVIEIAK